ncbi:MAG TPA: hypothetical protein VFK37_07655 [Bacillales bacterium]|nr:hypothetical protein [Bacillales bacterium]
MKSITFNPLRTIGIPNLRYLKPEQMFKCKDEIKEADWLLFPEYWQVNALVYGYKKAIFPSEASYHLGHDKIEMTRVLQAVCPDQVPYTRISANTEASIQTVLEEFDFPFIAKEVRNSMGRGVYLIESEDQLRDYAARNEVLYVQEYLPIDRDMRIAVVGEKVIGAYWRIGMENSHLNNVSAGGEISFDPIPREAIDLVEEVAINLGIDHAGFDVAVIGNRFYIFEFNILFGNVAFQKMNISIEQHIYDYLQNRHHPSIPPTTIPPTFTGKKPS